MAYSKYTTCRIIAVRVQSRDNQSVTEEAKAQERSQQRRVSLLPRIRAATHHLSSALAHRSRPSTFELAVQRCCAAPNPDMKAF